MAENEMKRHPLAIAWDEWLASDEGQQARDINTLARYTDRYLENRLKRAFDAGAKAATPTPSDFEQLTRLREAVDKALSYVENDVELLKCPSHEQVSWCADCASRKEAQALVDQLREALAQRHTGGEKS